MWTPADASPLGHGRSQSSVPLLRYADSPTTPSFPPPRTMSFSKGKSRPAFLDVNSNRRRSFFITCTFLSLISLATLALVRYAPDHHFVTSDLDQSSFHPLPTNANTDSLSHQDGSLPAGVSEHETLVEDLIHEEDIPPPPAPEPEAVAPSYSPYLVGPPTESFRDNLRNDTKYISSWISAGWNNDVMTYFNLLYLGKLTERVSIIGYFTPSHILQDGLAPPIAFGEVFNVPRFIEESGIPMVEWDEVKDPDSKVIDEVGCWNVWEAVQYYEHTPRLSSLTDWIGLDISYTTAPPWVKMIPNYEHDKCSTFWSLARLGFDEDRTPSLGTPAPSPQHNVVLHPDDHLLCYDYLFYACTGSTAYTEWEYEYAPNWREVGRHMHWSPKVEAVSWAYVRGALNLQPGEEVPPYITIHVRHGDFGNWCWEAEDPRDCFAPLSVIARRVQEVRDEILERKGIDIPMTRVIMTSDEKDPIWWEAVKLLGWVRIDHKAMHTVEAYGLWFPVVLDAAIQSLGMGFVGTDRSTFSVLSKRRVADWADGATRMVKWGKKDADAH